MDGSIVLDPSGRAIKSQPSPLKSGVCTKLYAELKIVKEGKVFRVKPKRLRRCRFIDEFDCVCDFGLQMRAIDRGTADNLCDKVFDGCCDHARQFFGMARYGCLDGSDQLAENLTFASKAQFCRLLAGRISFGI